MAARCRVCLHPGVKMINDALVAGQRVSVLSRTFKLPDDAVRRHKLAEHHLPEVSADAREAERVVKQDDDSIRSSALKLRMKATSLLMKAENAGRLAIALQGVKEARACLQLEAELEGRLATAPMTQVNVNVGDTQATAIAVLAALTPYPEARAAVLRALTGGGLTIDADAGPPVLEAGGAAEG